MRKLVTKPDGTTVVFEGTAEELAEFEQRIANADADIQVGPGIEELVRNKTDKRRILKG